MKIIFCNITYLRYYDGRVAGELKPETGGRWVQENEDAYEKWNFLNMNGNCYGYVQGMGEQIHIEKLGKVYNHQDSADEVIVVWCAIHPDRGTVVVGWYEDATIYRYLEELPVTPVSGLERYYRFSCKAEDAYLLPEEERTFKIGRASKDGVGKGFGQSNIWFAESEYAKEIIIPGVLEFMSAHKESRINTMTEEYMDHGNKEPLSSRELAYAEGLANEESKEFLPYGYRLFANEPSADNAYKIAASLNFCYQYSLALPWYEKTVELDPDDYITKGILAYMYQQLGMFDKSTATGKEILGSIGENDEALRDEIYCMFADNCFFSGDIREAITWQEKILSESKDKDLIENVKIIMEDWKQYL